MLTAGGCFQRAAIVEPPAERSATLSAEGEFVRQACATDATCEWPYACVEGACVLHGGEKCRVDSQCSSGQCLMGVCSIEM